MQYWLAGRSGQIPTHLCDVVRFVALDSCDCLNSVPNSRLQNMAVDMIGGRLEEGREPFRVEKSYDQLYSEAMFAAYANGEFN